MPDVVCVGILVADVVGKPVDRLPERGKLKLVEQMELHTGGCAANTGVALARIGVSTGMVGMVGSDGFGDYIVGAMARHGIDTAGIARSATSNTSATMVMVHDDGERSFLHYLGANADFKLEHINFDVLRQARIVHVGGALLMPSLDGEPTANLLARTRAAGVTTSLDTAWDSRGRWMELIGPCLPYVDYFIPSIEEARMLTGQRAPKDVARVLLDHGVGTVALKMGEEGCYIRSASEEIAIPVFPVDAIDALGAGDSFAAGFLTGVVHNWDLETTGRFATAVGGLCVTALGATTGVRTLQETLAFMREMSDNGKTRHGAAHSGTADR
ncbi:MAG: carbohydrate kinase family protein [Chloroflexi bacterium]|nr:carbohydrate kinase family protein [Chloroflexota bacterium]